MGAYDPFNVSHPGETLMELIYERGLTVADFSDKTGLDVNYLIRITNSRAPITIRYAKAFEEATGVPASFWLKRQQNYDRSRRNP